MASQSQKRRKRKTATLNARLKRMQARKEKQRRQRKTKVYDPQQYLTRNQQAVAERLLAGEVTMISSASWLFFERFLGFLQELGFFELINVEGREFYRQMIAVPLLIMTYCVKILLGLSSMNQVPSQLFRERALLLLIGYTHDQLLSGFCQRGSPEGPKPMHKNTLADAIEKLTATEVELILNQAVQRLAARGVFAQSHGYYALDSSDLPTTDLYSGAGTKEVTVRKRTRHGEWVDVVEYVNGFKVLVLYEVHLRLVVAAKVVAIQQHESQFTLELVHQARTNLAHAPLRVLLMDRGFLDGETLWTLKHTHHLDWIVPAKDTMHVTTDARRFRQERPNGVDLVEAGRAGQGDAQRGHVRLFGIRGLTSYDQYGDAAHQKTRHRADFAANPVNAIVVTHWEGQSHAVGREPVFLTSLSIQAPLAILDGYDLRSLIENSGFRELKQGWGLNHFPKKSAQAVCAHVFLTLVMFTLTTAYRTEVGQDITKQGIRRQRRAWHTPNGVFVLAGDQYAFFDLEELLILLGCYPRLLWHIAPDEVRHRYGLPDPPQPLAA